MGKVWLGNDQIGVFEPQIEGASGSVFINGNVIGTFTLAKSGYVLLDSQQIGTYWSHPAPPELPVKRPAEDTRYRTKIYLETYLDAAYLTKDDDSTPAAYAVIYANPNYPLSREFFASLSPVDLLFCVDTPESVALPVGVGYIEHVPITIFTINKAGITGTKLRWRAEAELRYVIENYPIGSLRTLERMSDHEQNLGSTILYSVIYILRYKRYA